jgi:peptide deformylase
MHRKILQIGNPKLRELSVEVIDFNNSDLQVLKTDLLDTLRNQPVGVAISAIQVGVPIAVFLLEIKPIASKPDIVPFGPTYFFNPQIIESSAQNDELPEACLSIMDSQLYGYVVRPHTIKLQYQDEHGTQKVDSFEGFTSRVIQHEVDHINGLLFTDKCDPHTLTTAEEYRKSRSRDKNKT